MSAIEPLKSLRSILVSIFWTAVLLFLPLSNCFAASDANQCNSLFETSVLEVEMPTVKIRFLDAFKWKDKSRTEKKPPFVPDNTKISEFMDKDGYVWLFRVIDSPYQRGFDESRFIKSHVDGYSESGYSYSLNPHIGLTWHSKYKFMLIARQKIEQDNMTFPDHQHGTLARTPLKKTTEVDEILNLYEVKVPVEQENVVAIVEQSKFNEFAASFGDQEFSMQDLLSKVLNDPDTKLQQNLRNPAP